MKNKKYTLLLALFVIAFIFVSCENKVDVPENLSAPILRVYVDVEEDKKGDAGDVYIKLSKYDSYPSYIVAPPMSSCEKYISHNREIGYVDFAIEKGKVYSVEVSNDKHEYITSEKEYIMAFADEIVVVNASIKKANVRIKSSSEFLIDELPSLTVRIGNMSIDMDSLFDYEYLYVEPGKHNLFFDYSEGDYLIETNVEPGFIEVKDGELNEIDILWKPSSESYYTNTLNFKIEGNSDLYERDSSFVNLEILYDTWTMTIRELHNLSLKYDRYELEYYNGLLENSIIEELERIPSYCLSTSKVDSSISEDGTIDIVFTPYPVESKKKAVYLTVDGSPLLNSVGYVGAYRLGNLYLDGYDGKTIEKVEGIVRQENVTSSGEKTAKFYKVNQKLEFKPLLESDSSYVEIIDADYEVINTGKVSFRLKGEENPIQFSSCVFEYLGKDEDGNNVIKEQFVLIGGTDALMPVGRYSIRININQSNYKVLGGDIESVHANNSIEECVVVDIVEGTNCFEIEEIIAIS